MAKKLALRVMARVRTKLQQKVMMTHVILESLIVILSALVFFPLSKIKQHFDQNCILHSDIYVTWHNNKSVSLDLTHTHFGAENECDYTTFMSVVVALHSLIWIWFFFHIDTLRCHDGSTVNLLLPALVTHTILMVCCLVTSIKIGSGFNAWCNKIVDNNDGITHQTRSCKEYEALTWTDNRSKFYTFSLMALINAWLLVAVIYISIVMTGLHLYWDFMATSYVEEGKSTTDPPLENSILVDSSQGVVNKAAYASVDGSNFSDSYDDQRRQSGHIEFVVDATVHNQDQPGTSGLRSRASTTA